MNALTRFESTTPVRYDVMNDMCTEVEARDTNLQEQINVLTTKTPFSCTAAPGYTISSQSCYLLNGEFTVSFLAVKTDGSVFTTSNNTVGTLPFTIYGTLYVISAIGKVGSSAYNVVVNGFVQSDKTITVVPSVADVNAVWVTVRGGVN